MVLLAVCSGNESGIGVQNPVFCGTSFKKEFWDELDEEAKEDFWLAFSFPEALDEDVFDNAGFEFDTLFSFEHKMNDVLPNPPMLADLPYADGSELRSQVFDDVYGLSIWFQAISP